MFLNNLTTEQQQLFLAAARAIAEHDGVVDDVEEALLDAIATECGAVPEAEWISVEELFDRLPGPLDGDLHARNAFVLELAGVAVVDGTAHPAELAMLSQIAARLDVEPERLGEFVRFATDARDLAARGRLLIATGDGS